MKKITTILMMLLVATFGFAQNIVSVDGNKTWKSYVAAFNVSDGNFAFGFEYDVDKNKTTFTDITATLQPNFEIWESNIGTVDPGWFDDANTPNKIVEVSTFIEDNNLAGSDLTFKGKIDSHTISTEYEVEAFIKALDPNNFATTTNIRVTLNDGDSDFSISATETDLPDGFIIQYGFSVTGLIADPSTESSLGSVKVSNNTSTAACYNGTQDGDETGVDCGGSCAPCEVVPTAAAPTPPNRPAGDVISIYGDAYGADTGLTNVNWDDSSVFSEVTEAGEDMLRMDFETFLGSSLDQVVDATGMTHFHMDFWVSDDFQVGQVFNTKWSNHTGGDGETDAAELTIALSSDDVQTWVSIDVPLSDFTNAKGNGIDARADLTQLLITPSGTIQLAFVDNIYFHKNTTLSNTDFTQAEFKAYPNPARAAWTIQTTEDMKAVQVYNIAGSLVRDLEVNASKTVISTEGLSSGVYLAKISNGSDQTKTIKLIKE